MEKQKNNLSKVVFGITFFATMLMMPACKERKEPAQDNTISQTKVKAPEIDTHRAVINNNSESYKQNTTGFNLNEKDATEAQVKREPRVSNWLWNLISGPSQFLCFVTNI